MKYFAMCGHLNEELQSKFIEFSNINFNEPWIIILNTSGGAFFATEVFIKMINEHSDTKIIVQGAFSAGMHLLAEVKCKIILSNSCRGMWHYGRWDLQFNDKNKPYYYDDEAIIRNMPWHKKYGERLAKRIMNKKELKDFNDDKDVYFDFKRMKEIFPQAEIMK